MGNFNTTFTIPDLASENLLDLLLNKDYKSEALGFISDNKSRVINYWESKNLMAVKSQKEKHKKYSFIELVWLNIVKILKDFGFDFEVIQKIKKNLLNTKVIENSLKELENSPEMQRFVSKFQNIELAELKHLLKELTLHKGELTALKDCELTILVGSVFRERIQINLLIHQDGEYFPYDLSRQKLYDVDTFNQFISKDHVSISLNQIINFHLPKQYIKDPIRHYMFTKEELVVLEAIKKKGLKSVEITFDGEKIDLITSKYKKKVDLNQRLYEIITGGSYQDITIKVESGKIVHCINSIKSKV